jgi:hypothetical protein
VGLLLRHFELSQLNLASTAGFPGLTSMRKSSNAIHHDNPVATSHVWNFSPGNVAILQQRGNMATQDLFVPDAA